VLAAAIAFAPAARANPITNGWFEPGDVAGRTQGGNTFFAGVAPGVAFQGTYAAFLSSIGTLNQTITDIAGLALFSTSQ
jgi:hypothetical protein